MTVKMLDGRGVQLALLVLCGLFCWSESAKSASCPWDEPGLLKWSEASTWKENKVPKPNQEVTIESGKRVLLDAQPETLATLKIEPGAALIWGNVPGLVLSTHYILNQGEFHIGSEECKFEHKAHIRLLGTNENKYSDTVFGRKFIGVTEGATLELHGKNKTSWSKLAQTVRRPDEIKCGFVYEIEKSELAAEGKDGVRVILWDTDGRVLDYSIHNKKQEFEAFFKTIPSGKIIGIHAASRLNTQVLSSKVLDNLGGTLVKNSGTVEFYAFVGKKDEPSTIKEFLTKGTGKSKRSKIPKDVEERYLSYHEKGSRLVFGVSLNTRKRFRVLDESVAFPVLTLASEVHGWSAGDQVLVTSTDVDWEQAEIKELVKCDECNSRQIKVNETFRYLHYGNFTMNVDERAEVAMLTRNILIEGIMSSTCPSKTKEEKELCKLMGDIDTFGGHLRINRFFKSARIEGVQLVHMGQQIHLGSYPLHFHMCDTVNGAYLRQNTVLDSFSRCFTVHGTNNLKVLDNVCFRHRGHGLFLEDSVEQNNTIKGNLVGGTMFGTLLLSDRYKLWCEKKTRENCGDVSSYWLTHPNNIVEDNVAVGGQAHGFTYMFADHPLGPSKKRQEELGIEHDPRVYPMHFTRNAAHSYDISGVFADCKISNGGDVEENGVVRGAFEYYPKINGKQIFANLSHTHSFKIRRFAFWVKGGNIRTEHCAMADSREGFSGGTSLMNSGSRIYKSIFIGETDNKGYYESPVNDHVDKDGHKTPYTSSINAVTIYQGPILVENCFIDKYETKDFCRNRSLSTDQCSSGDLVTRYVGGITWKRHVHYPLMSSSYVEDTTFGFCDEEKTPWVYQGPDGQGDFVWRDGNTMVYVQDKDGSLSGTPGAVVVNDIPLYMGPECEQRPHWGPLALCPYRYIKLKILGEEGSLATPLKKQYPLNIWRTDKPYDEVFTMNADIRSEFLLRTARSFIIELNTTLNGAGFSREYTFFGFGVEKVDQVRVGICQPKYVDSYGVVMRYPAEIRDNATWATDLSEVDDDQTGQVFFHDKENGILFFKVMSFHDDDNATQQCPQGNCWKVKITVNGWDPKKSSARSCRDDLQKKKIVIPDFVDNRPEVKKLNKKINKVPKCKKGSPEGLGPDNIRNPGYVHHKEFQAPCRSIPDPMNGTYEGCFLWKTMKISQNIEFEELSNPKTMTGPFCVTRSVTGEECYEVTAYMYLGYNEIRYVTTGSKKLWELPAAGIASTECFYRGYVFAAVADRRTCTCGNELIRDMKTEDSACSSMCGGNTKKKCGGSSRKVWNTGYKKP